MFEMPDRRRIYLMRHGEAAYVSQDGEVTTDPRNVPLTAIGREQAQIQGHTLASIDFDRAVCSGLPRTKQTAELVLAQSEFDPPDIEFVPQMEEIRGGGPEARDPEMDPREAIANIANPWANGAAPGSRFLGGELFSDFAARIVAGWEELLANKDWQIMLLVLHGAVNRMIFNHISGLDWQAEFCVEQDNCCINVIDVDGTPNRRYLVRTVNLTTYNLSKEGIVLTNMEETAKRIAEILYR
jgi:probable phosphoglycerate mutase